MDSLLVNNFIVICIFVGICALGMMKYLEIKILKNIIENEKAQMSLINALIGSVQEKFDKEIEKIQTKEKYKKIKTGQQKKNDKEKYKEINEEIDKDELARAAADIKNMQATKKQIKM